MIHLTGFDFLFAVAFIIGLVTLNILAGLREEGEVGREVLLGELMTQTGPMSRVVSTVPGLGFVSRIPLNYLRRVPGFDVAIGVTAYELADIVRTATSTVARGRRATTRITRAVETSLSPISEVGEAVEPHGAEVAQHAARGVIHAASETPRASKRLVPLALRGVIRALSRTRISPEDILWGTGFGVIQGSEEAGTDIAEAATQAIAGAREAAQTLGIATEEVAAEQAAEGILAAAQAVAQVKQALPPELAEG